MIAAMVSGAVAAVVKNATSELESAPAGEEEQVSTFLQTTPRVSLTPRSALQAALSLPLTPSLYIRCMRRSSHPSCRHTMHRPHGACPRATKS